MADKIAAKPSLVRISNQRLLIDTIKEQGPISRARLSNILKLSAPSVSNNVEKLLQKNILLEVGEGDSSGGRRPQLLSFNGNYGYIIGIDMTSNLVKVIVGNLIAESKFEKKFTIPPDADGKVLIEKIITTIEEIFIESKIVKNNTFAICIATPGVANDETGKVLFAPQFKNWDQIHIRKIIMSYFNIPVLLKNDINTAALGELRYGVGIGCKNFLLVSVDIGVGAGIIIDGKLYEGSHRAAGEIGYTVLDSIVVKEKTKFKQGQGYLEGLCSLPAFISSLQQKIKAGGTSIALDMVGGKCEDIDINIIVKCFYEGDELVNKHIMEYATIMGVAIANICNVLDMELVVMNGGIMQLGDKFLTILQDIIQALTPFTPKVMFSSLEDRAGILGTLAVGIDYIHKNALVN